MTLSQREERFTMDDATNKFADGVKDTVDNVRDTFNEAGHRGAAEGEHAKRDVAGDEMTAEEKAGSVLNEGKENLQAEYDKTKRDIRNDT